MKLKFIFLLLFIFIMSCRKNDSALKIVKEPSSDQTHTELNVNLKKAKINILSSKEVLIANVDNTENYEISLVNNGNAEATGIQISNIESPFLIDSNQCLEKLAPGKQCIIKLKFSPKIASSDITEQKAEINYHDGVQNQTEPLVVKYKSVTNNVLDLSKYNIATMKLTINTSCQEKKIYGNGIHNIPIKIALDIKDNTGHLVSIPSKELMHFIQIGGGDTGSPFEVLNTNENYNYTFSKCLDSNYSVFKEVGQLYFKTQTNWSELQLTVNLKYVDKKGEVHTISSNNGDKLSVLRNPFNNSHDIFKLKRESFKYLSYNNVSKAYFALFRITPNIDSAPTLKNFVIKNIKLQSAGGSISKTIGAFSVSSRTENVHKYFFPWTDLPTFSQNHSSCKNNVFQKGHFLYVYDRLMKKENNFTGDISIKVDHDVYNYNYFDLYRQFNHNDLALVTASQLLTCKDSHEESAYTVSIHGLDKFGNEFTSNNNDKL